MEDFPTLFGYAFETSSKCVVHLFTYFKFNPQFQIIIPKHYLTEKFYNQLRMTSEFLQYKH